MDTARVRIDARVAELAVVVEVRNAVGCIEALDGPR
jgi:hypothetical protein